MEFRGRTLPKNDWEGDDAIPFVTCMDTSLGRAAAWATNGRVDIDGTAFRAHLVPRDRDGINFDQAADALLAATDHLVLKQATMTKAEALAWLRAGKGLIIIGYYSTLPRQYRQQDRASFTHAMFVPYISGSYARLYDPLDRNLKLTGRRVPASILWPFMASLKNRVAYIPLHDL